MGSLKRSGEVLVRRMEEETANKEPLGPSVNFPRSSLNKAMNALQATPKGVRSAGELMRATKRQRESSWAMLRRKKLCISTQDVLEGVCHVVPREVDLATSDAHLSNAPQRFLKS